MIRAGYPFPQPRLLCLIGYTAHNTSLQVSYPPGSLPCQFGQVLRGPGIEIARYVAVGAYNVRGSFQEAGIA